MEMKTQGVKREASRRITVTSKSSINKQNNFHTTSNLQREEKQPPSPGLRREGARRNT
jgi:hypothetical protein